MFRLVVLPCYDLRKSNSSHVGGKRERERGKEGEGGREGGRRRVVGGREKESGR